MVTPTTPNSLGVARYMGASKAIRVAAQASITYEWQAERNSGVVITGTTGDKWAVFGSFYDNCTRTSAQSSDTSVAIVWGDTDAPTMVQFLGRGTVAISGAGWNSQLLAIYLGND
jgi:hypothetical protein